MDYEVLKFIWWVLIGVLFIGFAIMDGYDLGTANLLPFMSKTDDERRIMINAVAPHWDGNQVWLITAGGALFAAWPIVYATAFSGFYWAMLLVLFSLIGRPLAFDYRSKVNPEHRKFCDWGLFISGIIPSLVFGVAFGNLFLGFGFDLDDTMRSSFTQGFFSLLNPFALLCGVVSIAMLTMQGAVWQSMRSGSPIKERAATVSRLSALVTLVTFALAGVWVANLPGYEVVSGLVIDGPANPLNKTVQVADAGAWLINYTKYPIMLIAPIMGFAGAIGVFLTANSRLHGLTFACSSMTQAGVIMTAGFSLFPFILPSSTNPSVSLTLWDAVSSHLTLGIMTVVAFIFVPTILIYTSWCFYKMWGRMTAEHINENSHSLY
ncbi:cytochrome d ubiquinol oxidase subunit II [Endozoicomonas numazuensis]|uniref:Cytochrome d ubiquinol oxidase subunit 2 n=1 Tax=Endozoicomonas numazuensis TaxID=1137799 RepID=A0A081NHA7_9GAMM|nr:cytochrome d ubiquinol oxidase subunit II [Endozoicomonas numazuensis]KEQ17830.1 cytochrome d ubiquinol oxidase subunit 2 [Endozoicomonas numazuensis]